MILSVFNLNSITGHTPIELNCYLTPSIFSSFNVFDLRTLPMAAVNNLLLRHSTTLSKQNKGLGKSFI